ncbi:MAG: 3-methyl-2-oxobutanoate hydroxymethyltransferase [Armatimonadota bacterium]|nr:3-methyl-2-oxobutanoate hydroxymethyltransferase [Armatimonadota bacterium]
MLTAYDFPSARLAEAAGVDALLVGDSLAMVVLGHETTIPVTLEEMLHHVKAAARGASRALVVADMPFLTYHAGIDDAVLNCGRMLKEGGAHAVKIEGGEAMAPLVERLVRAGIPVLGHIGLLPQSVHQLGGYRVQGKSASQARQLLRDARALEEAGAFAVVLELVPAPLAAAVSARLTIPTIGIGSGAGCDGQIQVWHDILGLSERVPRHAHRFADLRTAILNGIARYVQAVHDGEFPASEHAAGMDEAELRRALQDEDCASR